MDEETFNYMVKPGKHDNHAGRDREKAAHQVQGPKIYDVTVIGLGICGAASAYYLAQTDRQVLLLEAENDVSTHTSKANSAILHAGYDPEPGSLMAKSNVRGAHLARLLCRDLDVPRHEIGSLVLSFSEEDDRKLLTLWEQGRQNAVRGLEIWDRDTLRQHEPALSSEARGALFAPTAAVVDPWEYTLALTSCAIENGADCQLNSEVSALQYLKEKDCYAIRTSRGDHYYSRAIVNCAGLYADRIHEMAGGSGFRIKPSLGQYYLLDKSAGQSVHHVIFQCPSELGKGILVSPTVHGNLIVGPDAVAESSRKDTSTTASGLAYVRAMAERSVPHIPWTENIRNFAGLRAASEHDDFIVEASPDLPRFINIAGIKSPGLTSAPALAEMALELLRAAGLEWKQRPSEELTLTRRRKRFRFLDAAEQAALCQANPAYGRIVCRCETVTEGEILETFSSPLPPQSVEAVKRRCNAGMGRCQGGFCGPRIVSLLARHYGLDEADIPQDRAGTNVLLGDVKSSSATEIDAPLCPAAADKNEAQPLQSGTGALIPPPQKALAEIWDVLIIGAGPAGLAAALGACREGAKVLLLERDSVPGGILNQCIHNGFGLSYYGEELTGPEYAQRSLEDLAASSACMLTDCMVLGIDGHMTATDEAGQGQIRWPLANAELTLAPAGSALHEVYAIHPEQGALRLKTRALVLAMGCRERARGAVVIPGSRPAGIMTAGTAQRYMNIENKLPGKKVVILGSGDIGLIMARRLALEGAEVLACVELLPWSSGLTRNQVQCLDDFAIPLLLSHTVSRIDGYPRISGVEISAVDEHFRPIAGSSRYLACDCLLLSVGLIPENELSRALGVDLDPHTRAAIVDEHLATSVEGVFSCGNVLHVHDLVDFVSAESLLAGQEAARYAHAQKSAEPYGKPARDLQKVAWVIQPAYGITYTVPQQLTLPLPETFPLRFRVRAQYAHVNIELLMNGRRLAVWKRHFLAPGEMQEVRVKEAVSALLRQQLSEAAQSRLSHTEMQLELRLSEVLS